MITQLIRAVNHFTGKFKQPIKLETSATGIAVDIDCLAVNEFMVLARFVPCLCHLLMYFGSPKSKATVWTQIWV